jgi:hypothetical protein
MRLLIRMGLVLALLLVLAAGAFLYLPAIGSFSRKALNYSVTKKVGGSVIARVEPCAKQAKHRFRCPVSDKSGSGGADYVVTLNGRCWKARRLGRANFEGELARRKSGCVKWRDQLRVFDRSP